MSTDTTRPAAARPDRWTSLPDVLLSALSPREHQLVHLLLSYRWTDDAEIYPYVGTMAARLDCSKRTIQRTLASLEAKGYLVVVARYRDESGHEHHGQTSNRYEPGPMLLPLLPRADGQDDGPAEQPRRAPMTPPPHRNTNRNENTRTSNRNGRYTPPLPGGRCFGCGSDGHESGACPKYGSTFRT